MINNLSTKTFCGHKNLESDPDPIPDPSEPKRPDPTRSGSAPMIHRLLSKVTLTSPIQFI